MTTHPGLVNSRPGNEVIDLLLPMPQGLDEATSRRIGKRLKCVQLRFHAYTLSCIYRTSEAVSFQT